MTRNTLFLAALSLVLVAVPAVPAAAAPQRVTAEIQMASGWTLEGTLDLWRGAIVEDVWTYRFGIGLVGGRVEVQARNDSPIFLTLADGTTIERVFLPELAQHSELMGARVRIFGNDAEDGTMIVSGITLLE